MRQYLPKSWKLLYQLLRRYCREHLFSKLQFALKHQNTVAIRPANFNPTKHQDKSLF